MQSFYLGHIFLGTDWEFGLPSVSSSLTTVT